MSIGNRPELTRHLTRLSRQTLWENAFNGILAQGRFSYDKKRDSCVYRMETKKGKILHCGIGHSIPDSIYRKSMELNFITPLIAKDKALDDLANDVRFAESEKAKKAATRKLNRAVYLADLQEIHDDVAQRVASGHINKAEGLAEFKAAMYKFAEDNKLKVAKDQ